MSKLPQPKSPGEELLSVHLIAYKITFEREYRFDESRKWRFDFAFPEHKIAVEVEGMGRHQTFVGYGKDCEKYNSATLAGWRVLRFTTKMVKDGAAIDTILAALEK